MRLNLQYMWVLSDAYRVLLRKSYGMDLITVKAFWIYVKILL
jgi:hypothetical protein